MPWGDWINELPMEFFMAVHVAAFAIGAGFAWIAHTRGLSLLTWSFTLFALAEAGCPQRLASALGADPRVDVHALIELVERGCRPELAARILAPLDGETV